MNRKLVSKKPVAKFFYRGTHTHPVRRTVLIVEDSKDTFTGYELREGKQVRTGAKAPIKSYSKNDIAKGGDYCRLPKNAGLSRLELIDLIAEGV